jgi:GTP pyrophosphokinase
VFTPKGDVIALTRSSTAVDFAYRIHTEVGNHMKGARVNGRWSPLDRPLENGDIVEIVTSKNSHPSLDWLNFVVTPTARNRIRQWYKRSHREENIARGKELLEKQLGKSGLDSLLKSETMQAVAQKCNYQKVEDLLAGLGYGQITCVQVINRLRDGHKTELPPDHNEPIESTSELSVPTTTLRQVNGLDGDKYPIAGIEGLVYHLAGCCRPLPGESIIGVVTASRGISIHHQGCPNLDQICGDRLIPVRWNYFDGKGRIPTYPVDIAIETIDRVGILRDILARLSDRNINVSNAGVKTNFSKPALISLTIDIQDCEQLQYIINQIKNMSDVLNIRRVSEVNYR